MQSNQHPPSWWAPSLIGKKTKKQRTRASRRPRSIASAFADRLLELNRREDAGPCNTNGKKGRRVDTLGFEDGRRHLYGSYRHGDSGGLRVRPTSSMDS